MRICPNCGNFVEEDASTCPSCGAAMAPGSSEGVSMDPVAPETPSMGPAGRPKGKFPVAAVVAAVVLVAALAVGAWAATSFFASPAKKFISYHENLFVSGLLEVLSDGVDRQTADDFSSDLTVTAQVDDPAVNYYLEGWSVQLCVDSRKDSVVSNVDITRMGRPVVNGTLTYEEGKVGFLFPQADNTYYVFDVAEYYKNLTGQELQQETQTRPEVSGKQWVALARAYLDIVYGTVTKENVKEAKNQSVALPGLGDSFTGTVYTFTPKAGDIENMLTKLADHLEKDEELRDLIIQLVGSRSMNRGVSATWGILSDDVEDRAELKAQLEEALTEMAQNMREEAQKIGREVADAGFTWTLAVEGDNVRQIRIAENDGRNALVYEAKGDKTSGRAEVFYVVSSGTKEMLIGHNYTRDGKHIEGNVTVSGPALGTSMLVTYDVEQGKLSVLGLPYGQISLSIPEVGAEVVWTVGAGAEEGEDHVFAVHLDPDLAGNSIRDIELTIHATHGSTATRPDQDPVDITDYSPEELSTLLRNIGSGLGGALTYAYYFGNMPGSIYGW